MGSSLYFENGVHFRSVVKRIVKLSENNSLFLFGARDTGKSTIILECIRLNEYLKKDFKFSYLRTKDDLEIDLIIGRPGQPDVLVEIKSTDKVMSHDVQSLSKISKDWDRECQAYIWSTDEFEKKEGSILCMSWRRGIEKIFGSLK